MSEENITLTADVIKAIQRGEYAGTTGVWNAICNMARASIELRAELAEENARHVTWLEMHGIEVAHALRGKLAAEQRAARVEKAMNALLVSWDNEDREQFCASALPAARAAIQEAK